MVAMKVSLIAVTYGVTVDLELPSKRTDKENCYYLTYVADPRKSQFSKIFFIWSESKLSMKKNPNPKGVFRKQSVAII